MDKLYIKGGTVNFASKRDFNRDVDTLKILLNLMV